MKLIIQQANTSYAELKKFMANTEYMKYLMEVTSFLPHDSITKQRLWHLDENNLEIVVCKCKTPLKWNIKNNSYRRFCSSKCAHIDESVKLKTEKTCMDKYGVKTNLITADAKIKYARKMIEKFETDNPFKSKKVQDDIRDAFEEQYGVRNVAQIPEVKKKINDTHRSKYNRVRQNQMHFSDESFELKYDKDALVELYQPGVSIKDIASQLDVGYTQLCVQFNTFGIELHQTVGQQQMHDFIKSIYSGEIIYNDRKALEGKEIDIYIPELNIGFEYDGIFWHCQNSANKVNYHIEKDDLAKSKGIKLFHILDLEWKDKQELVKSRIASLLGSNIVIYARKTKLTILDKKIAVKFFNENHIQENAGASFYVGLEYGGKIVSAMSLSKSRYNSSEFELIRFCNVMGHNVVGAASKLFKFATNELNASNVISFCDIRWGTGKVYEKIGFKHVRDNSPSYTYTHNYRTLENRIAYQKHKLSKILPIFDENLSEWENMKNNKYDRYWNSGNSVWLWEKEL